MEPARGRVHLTSGRARVQAQQSRFLFSSGALDVWPFGYCSCRAVRPSHADKILPRSFLKVGKD